MPGVNSDSLSHITPPRVGQALCSTDLHRKKRFLRFLRKKPGKIHVLIPEGYDFSDQVVVFVFSNKRVMMKMMMMTMILEAGKCIKRYATYLPMSWSFYCYCNK